MYFNKQYTEVNVREKRTKKKKNLEKCVTMDMLIKIMIQLKLIRINNCLIEKKTINNEL